MTAALQQAPQDRRALLLDAENFGPLRRSAALSLVQTMLAAAGPFEKVVVSVSAGSWFAGWRQALKELGIQDVRDSKPGKDGADRVLVSAARNLKKTGFSHFTIASGDHYFRRLPGVVQVLVHATQPVGPALARRSDTIVRLPAAP